MRGSARRLVPVLLLLGPLLLSLASAAAEPTPIPLDHLAGLELPRLTPEDLGGPQTPLLLSLSTFPPTTAHEATLERLGARVTDTFEVARALRVEVPVAMADHLAGLPFIANAAPDEPVAMNLASSKRASGLPAELVAAGLTGEGVTIALVDTGIDQAHPGLRDRVLLDMAVTPSGVEVGAPGATEHGTHVAGILVGTGAGASRAEDVSGVAPGSRLVSLDLSTQFTTSNALRAFEWIYKNHEKHDIRVVSNSWGRQRDAAAYDPDDAIIRASDALVAEGLVVVFSSGNGGDAPGRMTLEATNPNVITVGAVTDGGVVESYSSRGPVLDDGARAGWTKPDLVAPGSRIVSTRSEGTAGNHYLMMNGTSMAAPHVSAAAALLLQARPSLTPGQVKGLLLETARDISAPGLDDETGHGMLDIHAAVRRVESSGDEVREESSTLHRQGQITGPAPLGGVLPVASSNGRDAFNFEVPRNTTAVRALVEWTGKGPLKVTLRDPLGSAKSTMLRSSGIVSVDAPLPGTWRMLLEADELDRGEYEAEVTLTWLERTAGLDLPVSDMSIRTDPPFGGPPSVMDRVHVPVLGEMALLVPLTAVGSFTLMSVGWITVAAVKRRRARRDAEEEARFAARWARVNGLDPS